MSAVLGKIFKYFLTSVLAFKCLVSEWMLFLAICDYIIVPVVLVFVISLNDSLFPISLLDEGKVSLPIFDKTSEFFCFVSMLF